MKVWAWGGKIERRLVCNNKDKILMTSHMVWMNKLVGVVSLEYKTVGLRFEVIPWFAYNELQN